MFGLKENLYFGRLSLTGFSINCIIGETSVQLFVVLVGECVRFITASDKELYL